MTLWWIGDAVLLLVVVPVVVFLLRRRPRAAASIPPTVHAIANVARRGLPATSTPSPLLLTTQDQVIRTVQGLADYGGSLDVILDDAGRRRGASRRRRRRGHARRRRR